MADDVSRSVLGDILILERILFVVAQDDSAVKDDVEVPLVVEYDLPGLFLDDSQLGDQGSELLVGASCLDQAPKEGLVLEVAHSSVRTPRKPGPLLVVQQGG